MTTRGRATLGTEPYYTSPSGLGTLYCGDCLDIIPQLGPVDAVVTDPPYGLGDKWVGGTWFTRGAYKNGVDWDTEAPQKTIEMCLRFGNEHIVWGGNYFSLPPSRCWLAWTKDTNMQTMSDLELAWTDLDRPAKMFHASRHWNREHPTEKPITLMKWCLGFLEGETVLDPFLGSGTTAVACERLGRRWIGIEISEDYCAIAARRIADETRQRRMF
ncbi:MAG: DNA methyltransferase [bacterium]